MNYPCQALIVASSCRDFDVALMWLGGSLSANSATLAHIGSLHRGDNLDILHRYLKDKTTKLIRLEPPQWDPPP